MNSKTRGNVFLQSKAIVLAVLVTAMGYGIPARAVESTQPKFPDLAQRKGEALKELIKDRLVADRLHWTVPVSRYNCMNDIFEYMPPVELASDGSIQTNAMGSRAEGFRSGFFALTPAGDVDVVLQCENGKPTQRVFQYFTTRAITVAAPSALMSWLRMQAIPGDNVVRTGGGSGGNNFDYPAITKTTLNTDGRERQTAQSTAPAQPRPAASEQHYIVTGGVICGNPYDFFKVNAIERTGNHYASLPVGCETVGADVPVNFIRSSNNFLLVGNSGGTGWIRPRDFR